MFTTSGFERGPSIGLIRSLCGGAVDGKVSVKLHVMSLGTIEVRGSILDRIVNSFAFKHLLWKL